MVGINNFVIPGNITGSRLYSETGNTEIIFKSLANPTIPFTFNTRINESKKCSSECLFSNSFNRCFISTKVHTIMTIVNLHDLISNCLTY